MTNLGNLVNFIAHLRYEDLPLEVVDDAKKRFLEVVVLSRSGINTFGPDRLTTWASQFGHRDPGATILGTAEKVPPGPAAWANAGAAHVYGLDDFHPASSVHPGVTVIPAALAVAEQGGARLKELILAIVVGYEVACRVGRTFESDIVRQKGFHPTTLCGALGAASACIRLAGGTNDTYTDTLSLTASLIGGLSRFGDDSAVKSLEVGQAAHLAVNLSQLVLLGMRGTHEALDQKRGFFPIYGGHSLNFDALDTELGTRWEILHTSFKPKSQATSSHVVVEAVTRAYCQGKPAIKEMDRIEIEIPKGFLSKIGEDRLKLGPINEFREAQQNLRISVAVALRAASEGCLQSDPLIDWYRDLKVLNSTEIKALSRMTIFCESSDITPRGMETVVARIYTHDRHISMAEADTYVGDASGGSHGVSWSFLESRCRIIARLEPEDPCWSRLLRELQREETTLMPREMLLLLQGCHDYSDDRREIGDE